MAFGLPASSQPKSHSQYVHDLKSRLEESHQVATENASKTAERNKRFDKRVVESTLEAGDRVLMRNVRIRGKHKLADKWESDVHTVVKRVGDLPVYTVKPEGKDGPFHTLHRDLLLPCGFLPVAESKQSPKQTINKPRTRRQSRMEVKDDSEVAGCNSESEDDDYYCYSSGGTLNTDLIETRLLTRPATVSSGEGHLRETKLPVAVNLEEKAPSIMERRERDKGYAYGRKSVQRIPVEIIPSRSEKPLILRDRTSNESISDRSNYSGWEGDSEVVDAQADVVPEHREAKFPNVRRVLFETSQDATSDNPKEDETMPVQLNLSFSDSSMDKGGSVSESCEGVSSDRTIEGTAPEVSGRKATSPVIMGESESDNIPRRSQRHREQPDRLQYGQLGNPLLSIVQSLFQGLSHAFADALQSHDIDTPKVISRPVHSHMGVIRHTHL